VSSERLIFTPVPKHLLGVVWPKVESYLAAAVKTADGKCTVDDVRAGIESDVYLLWVVVDGEDIIAAVTTRVIEYPKRNGMAVDWLGGRRMKEWIGMVNDTVSQHARNHGCSHLEAYGRPAWSRFLHPHGWKEEYVAFRLEV
jgi:hypothetical protein